MNSLVSAAAEAEAILKKARWNREVEWAEDGDSEDGWRRRESHGGREGRRRPRASPPSPSRSSQSPSPAKRSTRFNIHDKLRELYDELSSDEAFQANYQGLKISSYLLEKLLNRMNLNVLILNLYPGNKGYSISLKVNGDTQMLSPPSDGGGNYRSEETLLETARWPYEEEDLLTYIDNEELPIFLLDLLEAEHSFLFYSGCIIAQIRDYRQAFPSHVCDTHHVLLKPTTQSIISDVNAIVRTGSWGREERLLLESAVVLATAPPLCLEPRPAVGLLAARLHHQQHLLATPAIRRQARRYSQVAVNRKRRLEQLTQQRGLGLLELLCRQRAKAPPRTGTTPAPRATSKFPKKPSEVLKAILAPKEQNPILTAPADAAAAVARAARAYERPRASPDCAPQLLEEYVLETERAPASPTGLFHIKLSILQRPSNQEYLGELYVDRDHVEGQRNGSACRFVLGTRAHANRYIQQFTEIFTEEGRKSVRIKHQVPGQLPRVSYTAGMREMGHTAQQLALQARTQGIATPATPLPSSSSPVVAASTLPTPVVPAAPLNAAVAGSTSVPSPAPDLLQTPRRSMTSNLPLLQAQLQAGPALTAASAGSPVRVDRPVTLASPGTEQVPPALQPSLPTSVLPQPAQPTANQLLAQQLTNPPQPLNLRAAVRAPLPANPAKRPTNPAIRALVTSLMNSAHQFQQAAAANAAAKSTGAATGSAPSNNATILNLLNSAPAAMTNSAGVEPKKAPPSALLERLMAPPTSAPPLGLMPGLQNVQVQIAGLAQPISLSLNVSAAGGGPAGLLVSVPVSQPTPAPPGLLSLPISHLMSNSVKGGTPLQLVPRPRTAPRPATPRPPATHTVGSVQYISQQPGTLAQQRRRSNTGEPSK